MSSHFFRCDPRVVVELVVLGRSKIIASTNLFFVLNFRVSQKIDKCTLESKRVKQEISNAYSQRFAGIPLSADTRTRCVCVCAYISVRQSPFYG